MNVFDAIPSDFFNCLASSSNKRIYADCLDVIYRQYEKEISFRIPRDQIRAALSLYLLENHVELKNEEDITQENVSNANEMANFIVRKFISCAWLQEEKDDATFERFIVMSDNGIALAEFLQRLAKPSRPEFSSYILNIYNRFSHQTGEQKEDPYNLVLKPTFQDAKALSSSLKMLSTSIKKTIETMLREGTLVSLTENIISYCDGDFIKEYSRLVKQQNIHIYRNYITRELEILKNGEIFETLCASLKEEEKVTSDEAENRILEMIGTTKRFLHDDYNKIMDDIKQKINTYIRIAISRERMLKNKGMDMRGCVDETLRSLVLCDDFEFAEEKNALFNLQKYEFIDKNSVRYPHAHQSLLQNTQDDFVELSEEELRLKQAELEKESFNPYSKDLMANLLEKISSNGKADSSKIELNQKNDLLSSLGAVAYARENGWIIEADDEFEENENYRIRKWSAKKK